MMAMMANPPDKAPRRVAVILGTGGSGRKLLDLVLPLLLRDREIEMHGVFLEEAEVQHAAELPFVKELCRVTFSVREFTSDQFERSLALRMLHCAAGTLGAGPADGCAAFVSQCARTGRAPAA